MIIFLCHASHKALFYSFLLFPLVSVTSGNADIPHVMLSYNHSTQPRMIKICEKLRENGYKVWMDVDHMCEW